MGWFSTENVKRFGEELADSIMGELAGTLDKHEAKFAAKAEKALVRAGRRVDDFRASEKMNFYKRASLANAFLWKLKDAGCPPEYANQLTDWLTARL